MTTVEQATSTTLLETLGSELLALDDNMLIATLSTFSETDMALAEQAIAYVEQQRLGVEALEWRATPATMMHHLTAGKKQMFPYVKLLGEKFVDAVEGRSVRQIWNLPAQYGKSTVASQWGPAWALDRYPERRFILTSYGDDLATRNAYEVRDILRTNASVLNDRAVIRQDARRLDRFTTADGGGILARGIDAGITGWPAHGVVIDDPFKNWIEGHSPSRRETVYNQYKSVLRIRLTTDLAFIIVVMTRWHEDDLTARLIKDMLEGGEEWEVIRLSEVSEEAVPFQPGGVSPATNYVMSLPDPLDRETGEILESRRFSEHSVEMRRRSAGPYLWAGMHQQRPGPAEGGEFKRAWWKVETVLPPAFDQVITSWDMKLKEARSGDYQSGQCWGRTGSSVWLIEHMHGRWDMPTIKAGIALMQVRHPEASMHVIENTGNGPEVMKELRAGRPDYELSDEIVAELGMVTEERRLVQDLLRRGMNGLVPENPKKSKEVRARAHVGMLEGGDIHVLDNPGGRALIDQAASFPGGPDDMVDAWSQAMSRLNQGSASSQVPQGKLPGPTQRATPTPGGGIDVGTRTTISPAAALIARRRPR